MEKAGFVVFLISEKRNPPAFERQEGGNDWPRFEQCVNKPQVGRGTWRLSPPPPPPPSDKQIGRPNGGGFQTGVAVSAIAQGVGSRVAIPSAGNRSGNSNPGN